MAKELIKIIAGGFLCTLLGIIIGVVLLLFLASHVMGQEITPKKVVEFSGGLVTSIDDTLMQDNQARILDNYDVDELGRLRRRPGLQPHFYDALSGYFGLSLFSYYGNFENKGLLFLRMDSTKFGGGTPGLNTASLYLCDDEAETCLDTILNGFWLPRRYMSYPFNIDNYTLNNNMVIAGTGIEPGFYDGEAVIPFRPVIIGQPITYPLNGLGTISGTMRYRYVYSNANCPNASTPSYPVYVQDGQVWVEAMIPPQGNDSLYVFRQHNLDGSWYQVAEIYGGDATDSAFLDTMSITTAEAKDTLWQTEPKGKTAFFPDNFPCNFDGPLPRGAECTSQDYDTAAPGGITVTLDSTLVAAAHFEIHFPESTWVQRDQDTGLQLFPPPLSDTGTAHVMNTGKFFYAWAVVFIDSAGRNSYMTPPTIKEIADVGATYRSNYLTASYWADLTDLPIPDLTITDSAKVVKKLIIRALFDSSERHAIDQVDKTTIGEDWDFIKNKVFKFYILDTLEVDSPTYHDNISQYYHDEDSLELYCVLGEVEDHLDYRESQYRDSCSLLNGCNDGSSAEFWTYIFEPFQTDASITNAILSHCNDDSVIGFQPTSVYAHGSRLAAIGDPQNRNVVYFSDFGRPSTWPPTKVITIASEKGDYFIDMVGLGQALLLFRQNSITSLTGLNYYQYTISDVSKSIGVTAPRSLVGAEQDVYWLHHTGVYHLPGNTDQAISWPIEKSIDSASDFISNAWGELLEGEYWLSIPSNGDSVNNKVYIFKKSPTPHWRCYTFGVIDGATYDYESTSPDYRSSRMIFLLDNDSLYDWNYTPLDSLDDTARVYAKYQSKAFFSGPEREFIFYVDLMGTGSSDSMYVVLVANDGEVLSDTLWAAVDFSVDKRHRFRFNKIVENVAVEIGDHGFGDYYLEGYEIGWKPWDKGRNR